MSEHIFKYTTWELYKREFKIVGPSLIAGVLVIIYKIQLQNRPFRFSSSVLFLLFIIIFYRILYLLITCKNKYEIKLSDDFVQQTKNGKIIKNMIWKNIDRVYFNNPLCMYICDSKDNILTIKGTMSSYPAIKKELLTRISHDKIIINGLPTNIALRIIAISNIFVIVIYVMTAQKLSLILLPLLSGINLLFLLFFYYNKLKTYFQKS